MLSPDKAAKRYNDQIMEYFQKADELAVRFDMAIETEIDFIAIEETIEEILQEEHQSSLNI